MDQTTIAGILAGVFGLLIGGGIVGGLCWFRQRTHAQATQEAHGRKAAELQSQVQRQAHEIQRLHQAHRAELRTLEAARADDCDAARRERWFDSLRKIPWRDGAPEVEIEAKFVLQLLQFLGYEDEDMELRTSVPVQEGSKQITLQADWVVRDALGQALMVMEVKAPDAPVDDAAREQARSYAFRLGAPVYCVTNALELQIYHLGVVKDSLVFSCRSSDLRDEWELLEKVASKANVTVLRWSLGYDQN